jgi:hypothetical protein
MVKSLSAKAVDVVPPVEVSAYADATESHGNIAKHSRKLARGDIDARTVGLPEPLANGPQ